MKKILLSCSLLAIATTVMAQSLSNSGLNIAPSPFDATVLVAGITLTNNTNAAQNIICERTQNNLFNGHSSNFCWDLCYGPQTSLSGPVNINAMSSNTTSFIGDLVTGGIAGTSEVTYSFYVEGNPSDQTSVVISYVYTPTGIATADANKAGLSTARPNPADEFTTVAYSLKADPSAYKIEMVNMLGKKVAEYSLKGKNGVMTIPTNNLSSGIYFYVLTEYNKTISSQKLVVSHK